jgi:hypothetical protein
MSVSPVSAFLREEVCAVSDHLASVSLFDSEEWMLCLSHFNGWTDTSPGSEANVRVLVSDLKLKPLAEHGDVESPLLRSQIDEQFLKAMADQRKQMEMTGAEQHERRKPNKGTPSSSNRPPNPARNNNAQLAAVSGHMPSVCLMLDVVTLMFSALYTLSFGANIRRCYYIVFSIIGPQGQRCSPSTNGPLSLSPSVAGSGLGSPSCSSPSVPSLWDG